MNSEPLETPFELAFKGYTLDGAIRHLDVSDVILYPMRHFPHKEEIKSQYANHSNRTRTN